MTPDLSEALDRIDALAAAATDGPRLAAVMRAVLGALSEPQPNTESPYSYDPWDDESVDPSNLEDLVSAAFNRGRDYGEQLLAERISAAATTAWEEGR